MGIFNRVGGQSPHTDGLQITVTFPTATKQNPVKVNEPLSFDTVGPYTAKRLAADGVIQMKAIHSVEDGTTPLGVQVYGFSRIDSFEYSGTLAVGDTICGDGAGKVKKATTATNTLVCYVDSTRKICEVLM